MKTKQNSRLVQVIDSYLSEIESAVKLMKDLLSYDDLLNAWLNRKVAKEGQLTPKLSYKFHGVGCLLIFDKYDINFDFGPNGRCNGFDEWRLNDYISQKLADYPEYQNPSKLKEDFNELVAAGVIICPRWEPSKHLYYYKKDL